MAEAHRHPSDRSGIGVFTALSDLSNKRTRTLIEEAGKANAPEGSDTRKIADLYHSYMDEAGIESRGLAPIEPSLKALAGIHDKTQLAHALGESLRADVDALNNTNFHTHNLFGLWVAPGFSDSAHYAPYLLQGGLELPNRDYYLSDTDSMRKIRTNTRPHCGHAETRRLRRCGRSCSPHLCPRTCHRTDALEPGGQPGNGKGEQPLEAERFPREGPGA